MSNKKEEKNLNYIFKPIKEFSFRNDNIYDENENPNKTLISNSSSKKRNQINKETNKIQKKMNTKKFGSLNQIIVNRLIQENKFLIEKLEIAKSNILILEEKESQYKDTIEQINYINQEKEISYKNIMSLINNYKNRENQLNYKLSLQSKELIKKNEIINRLNKKIKELNEQLIHLKKIVSEKNKIINYYSRNKKISQNHTDLSLNCESNNTISQSLNNKNHNRKDSDVKLYSREKTLSNLSYKFCNFNSLNLNDLNKKYSNNRINMNNKINLYEKLNINNNNISENDNYNLNSNTESSNNVTKLIRKYSAYRKIMNGKNNIFKNIPKIKSMKKNNSYRIAGYNSVNSTINKKQNRISESMNMFQNKKPIEKKIFKNLKINSDKGYIKKMIMTSPSNRIPETKSNKNNQIINQINEVDNYSYIPNDEEKYLPKNNNKKDIKFNRKILLDSNYKNINEYTIPNNNKANRKYRKIEINKFFINNDENNSNPFFGNIVAKRNKLF